MATLLSQNIFIQKYSTDYNSDIMYIYHCYECAGGHLTVCAKQTLVLKKFAIFVMSYCGCSCMYTEWCATRLIVWLCGSIKVCVVVKRVEKLQDSLVAKLVLILIKRGGGRRRGGGEEGKENEEERGQGGRWRSGKREGEWKGRLTFTH